MTRWGQNAVTMTLLVMAVAACETTAPPVAVNVPVAPMAPAPIVPRTLTTCLMTHICGCNLGCTRMPLDPASLNEGASGIAETGPYAGKELKVVKEADTTGGLIFALADRDHDHSCERNPETLYLLAFACAAKDSGPVPANACAKGCE